MKNIRKPGLGVAVAPQAARALLDGLIAYRSELGELGRELELLLRSGGVRPSRADGPTRAGTGRGRH